MHQSSLALAGDGPFANSRLNVDQHRAAETIFTFLSKRLGEKSRDWGALLEGPAGSGKTWTVSAIIKAVSDAMEARTLPHRKILCAAPTHKAKKVLTATLRKNGVPRAIADGVTTVSVLVGRAPNVGEPPDENGKAKWLRNGVNSDAGVLFVDEVSMVDRSDALAIAEHAKASGMAVVFIGDFAQLRPVRAQSIQADMEKVPYRATLTEVMRADSGGDIVSLSKAVRTTGAFNQTDFLRSDTVQLYNSASDFLERFITTQGAVAIAYTNRRVAELNRAKREALYGANVSDYVAGEDVVLSEQPIQVSVPVEGPKGTKWTKVRIADNNDVLQVIGISDPAVKHREPHWSGSITCPMLKVRNDDTGATAEILALTPQIYEERFTPLYTQCEQAVREIHTLCRTKQAAGDKRFEIDLEHMSSGAVAWLVERGGSAGYIDDSLYSVGMLKVLDKKGKDDGRDRWEPLRRFAWAGGYYGVRERFAVLMHPHAVTAHKAQGSTYEHAFVDWPNLMTIRDPEDRRSACYVAVSRPSKMLHVRV